MVMRERTYGRILRHATRVYPTAALMPHGYTREPSDENAPKDAYSETTFAFGPQVANLPCQLLEAPRTGVDQAGNPTVVTSLQLLVPMSDPLKFGDRVTNVVDRASGQLLESGPVIVDTVLDVQPWGGPIYHVATLNRLQGTG